MIRYARLFILACLFTFSLGLMAQTSTTGAVNGVVADQSGAVVSGATVVLTNLGTGSVQKAKSSSSGSYRFDLLQPGDYQIMVDHPGFEKLDSKLKVDASQVVGADLKLTIGSDTQTIEVQAVAALINSENGNVANTVSQVEVAEVPNSGNNLLFETKITPGFNNGGSAFGVVGSTMYQIDGENFNDPYNNANNSGASNLTLGLDDVEEATITGNGYSGQFGGLVGATVSFVTKQGGNRVHGNMNYFWTGRALVANTFSHKEFANTLITNSSGQQVPEGPVARSFENANQWAAIISGPVTIPHLFSGKDKLFFLADAEGLRAILPSAPGTVLLPSTNLQNYITNTALVNDGYTLSIPYYKQAFGIYNTAIAGHGAASNYGNPNANNTATFPNAIQTGCPTQAGYLSQKDLLGLGFVNIGTAAVPIWQGPAGACSVNYASNAITVANEALEIFRVDYNISAKDKFFIRYEHDDGFQPTGTDPINAGFNTVSIQPQHDGQFNETHTFGAKATNNFILGGLWYGAKFGPANLAANLALFPASFGVGDGTLTTINSGIGSFPTGRNITTVQLQDDFAYSLGAHTLKLGAKAYYIKENDAYFNAGIVPTESAATLGAYINGGTDPANAAVGFSSFTQTFPLKQEHPVGLDQWAVYLEDDWKATHAFSLTAAVRVEHQGNIKCLDNCLTEVPNFPAEKAGVSGAALLAIPYNQTYNFNQREVLPGLQSIEWEPRVGFAYNPPMLHESLVVRGGYGIFYDGLAASVLESIAKNPPQKDSFTVPNDNLAPNEKTNLWTDTAAYNTAYLAGVTTGGTFASIKASAPTAVQPNFTPPTLYTAQPNFKMYNVQKWNLEVQKQFGKRMVFSANYLGNHGTHKVNTNAGLNAYTYPATAGITGLPTGTNVGTAAAPVTQVGTQTTTGYAPLDPRFGLVYYFYSGGSNNYNGIITSVKYNLGAGSVISAGYTYGKLMDDGAGSFGAGTGSTDIGAPPDPYHVNIFYGPAATDIRHNFVLDYVYKFPFGHGGKFFSNVNPVVSDIISGWQVSGAAYAYTGLPFTAIDTTKTSTLSTYKTGAYGASLLAVYQGGGEAICGYALQQCLRGTTFGAYGTSATASQFSSATSVGNPGYRNAFRGPAYASTDFAVAKSIPLHWEGGRFEASAQAFNVLNHLNFSKPTGSLSSSSFGKVTGVVNPSGIFSGVGGDDSPRIVQLKAKVTF